MCQKNSSRWILEADIKACFDNINHQWLTDNIQTVKRMLKQWLGCGFIGKGISYNTAKGTSQGGIISPTLMLLTLAA
ncbi:reverse transcriptase domain-containing protein [uncultured Shewanella sp.]|uniref:reverse transcriptase domain-containing protein n=1 Tax=uncultured Shewanella sp. TaxID=173975 RepID=UPI00261DAE2C|nr:reverse transcriptase domain-containing protein [uncultured Shewanella sp.]